MIGADIKSSWDFNEQGDLLINDETLEFMKIEIENTLKQDPRIPDYDLNIRYNDNGGVDVELTLHYTNDSDISVSLVITEDGSINVNNEGLG